MALHAAARSGDVETTRQLLESGSDVNCRDNHSRTPLHLAAWAGHVEVVHLLLEHKASVSVNASDDMTAIHFASQKGHLEVVRTLLAGGAKASSTTRKGFRPLHFASQNGHLHIIRLLARRAPDSLSCVTSKGKTPIELAKNQEVRDLLSELENELKEKKKKDGQQKKKPVDDVKLSKEASSKSETEGISIDKNDSKESVLENIKQQDDAKETNGVERDRGFQVDKDQELANLENADINITEIRNLKRNVCEDDSKQESSRDTNDTKEDSKTHFEKRSKISLAHLNTEDDTEDHGDE